MILAICARSCNSVCSSRYISAILAVILFQCNFYTRNTNLVCILYAVIILIVPNIAVHLCLLHLLQAAVPIFLCCGSICKVIGLSSICNTIFLFALRLSTCCKNQILICCSQINVLALIRIGNPEFAVTA